MNRNKNLVVLKKMLKYCEDSRRYAIEKTYDEFISDERNLVFSIFSLSQLGELVTAFDKSFTSQHNEIPWSALKSIRNRIVHDYEGVHYKIVWNIIQNEIPVLINNIQNILSQWQFLDLKGRLDEPELQRIFSLSFYQPTAESIPKAVERCRADNGRELWGVICDEKVIAVVEYCVKSGNDAAVLIHNIAVTEAQRGKGIGRFIVNALKEKHGLPIELETDDEAVGFYVKCGFKAEDFKKNGVRRWKCILNL